MKNLDKVFESWVNVSHTVLGIELKPFSLLHYLWLEQVNSPLVNTSLPCEISDLEIAVLICSSSTSEEIQKKINTSGIFKRFKAILWKQRNRKADLSEAIKAFLAYQDDYLCLPNYREKEDNGETEEKLPWLLVAAASLIKSTGWSEETVFSMPIGKVIWFYSTFGFLENGETNIISDKAEGAEEWLRSLHGLTE